MFLVTSFSLFTPVFLLTSAFPTFNNFPISVLFSPLTPDSALQPFYHLYSEMICDIDFHPVASLEDLANLKKSPSTVYIDLLYSELLSICLIELGRDSELQVVSGNLYSLPNQRSLNLSLKEELTALIAVAKHVGLTRFCLFLPADTRNYLQLIESRPDLEIAVEFVSEDATAESLKSIVYKQTIHFGFTSFLTVVSTNSTQSLLNAIASSRMRGESVRVLAYAQGGYFLTTKSGSMPESLTSEVSFLIRKECIDETTPERFLLCEISDSLLALSSPTSFAVMNMDEGLPKSVGSVSKETVLLTSPVFLSSQDTQMYSYQTLTMSFNNGTVNPSREAEQVEYFHYVGAELAIREINDNSELLPFHNMQISNLSLGLDEFNYDWAKEKITKFQREELGVAMLTGLFSGVAIGVYSLLADLGIEMPMVGAANTTPKLSSMSEFPYYARVVMSDKYLSILYGQILRHYNWKHIAIVYQNDTWSAALYELLLVETRILGISIENPSATHMLQDASSPSDSIHSLQAIVDSKCRIVILVLHGTVLFKSIAALYDLGMRRGDVLFPAIEWLDSTLFEQTDQSLRRKINELVHGAIQFYPVSRVGAVGKTFEASYEAEYGVEASMYSCFYYDAAYLIAHALDYLIAYGIDYNSPSNLMKSIRSTRFRGCSGVVALDQGTNDRSPMMYSIWNARVDSEGGYAIVAVGTYDPAGIVLFNFTDEIIWPDGTSVVPTDMRGAFEKCPFDERNVRLSAPAAITVTSIICTLSLILILATGCIWKKQWNSSANPLQTRAEISFDDCYVFVSIEIEALQYMTMGPLTSEWSNTISFISGLFTAQLESVMDMSKGQFWTVLIVTYSVVGLWAVLFFTKKSRVLGRVKCVQSKCEELANVLLPLIGNLGFLPVLSILLSVFQCTQTAHDSDLQSTFLTQDCFQHCWVTPHVYYVAASTMCLFLFIPAAVWLRPTWQDSAENLHIHTSPSYLMVKTMYEMTIVAFQNTVKRFHKMTHIALFLLITTVFCGFTVVKKPFGYERANLWHTLSLISVLWFVILSLVTSLTTIGSTVIWLGIFFAGVAGIAVFGLAWQWFMLPSYLYRREEVRLFDLFNYMFSCGGAYLYLFSRNKRTIEDDCREGEALGPRRLTLSLRTPQAIST